jgi:hypothetical protein
MNNLTPIQKGRATILWGTGNILNNSISGAIVDSITITPKNGEPTEIEDNDGFTDSEVILAGEWNADISVVFDSAKVWPDAGDNISWLLNQNRVTTARRKQS